MKYQQSVPSILAHCISNIGLQWKPLEVTFLNLRFWQLSCMWERVLW